MTRRSIGTLICLVMAFSSRGAAAEPPVGRKSQQSSFEIKNLNKLMMSAIDNSSNQVKFSTPPGEYVVHGSVLDSDNRPIAGAQVMLTEGRRAADMYLANFDVTDEFGRFVVQAAPGNQMVFVRADHVYCLLRTGGASDVVVRLPETRVVRFEVAESTDLFDDKVWVKARGTPDGETEVYGDLSTTLSASRAGEFRLAAGRYHVYGNRRLVTSKGPVRGFAELAQIEVADTSEPQSFSLDQREGTNLAGKIRDYASLVTGTGVIGIKLTLSVSPVDWQTDWRTVDTTICAADGTFTFGPIPPGQYLLQATTVADPKAAAPQVAFPNALPPSRIRKLFKERIEVAGGSMFLNLPTERESNGTVDRVHAILDSEHTKPYVSWSWSDVQISQLAGLEDREGTINELLRLLKADDTPSSWRSLVIDSLWRIRPISDKTKAALVEAMQDPANHQWRSSILGTLRHMQADAIEMIDLIIGMRDDQQWRIRYGVADAMGEIGKSMIEPPEKMIDTAIGLLDDPHGIVRKQAAGSLGELRSPRAIEALRGRMKDPYEPARALAAWALFECSGDVEPSLSTMVDLLETGDHEARRVAASYLGMFDHRAAAALPALRANTGYENKPPFNGTREYVQYQLRGAAERAIEAIEAGIGWQAEASKPFELRLDASQQARVNVMQFDAAWGPPSNGLEFGIVIDGDPATSLAPGDRIPIALLVRNTTNQPIRFEIDRRLSDTGPEVTDHSGKRQRVNHTRLLVTSTHPVATLPPGGVMMIPHPGIGLGENPRPRGQLWHPYVARPVAGKHKISQQYRFEVFDQAKGTKTRTWLKSGEIEVNLR